MAKRTEAQKAARRAEAAVMSEEDREKRRAADRERYATDPATREKKKASGLKYYAANVEKKSAQHKIYYQANKEKLKADARAVYWKDPQKQMAGKDPVAKAAAHKRWAEKNPEYRLAYSRKYGEENRVELNAASLVSKKRRIKALLAYIHDLKTKTPCADCGLFFPAVAMDFDHLIREDKLSDVSKLVGLAVAFEVLQAEIAKCEIVCANHHRIRTFVTRAGAPKVPRTPGEKRRAAAVAYTHSLKAASPCEDCGKHFHPVAMEFDHKPGTIKLAGVGRLASRGASKEVLDAEMAKCSLVCCGCHRVRTYARNQHRPPKLLVAKV